MGNDGALDAESALFKCLKIDEEAPNKEKQQAMNGMTHEAWMAYLMQGGNQGYTREKAIASTFLFMKYGADLPPQMAKLAIFMAKEEIKPEKLEEWHSRSSRKAAIETFIEAILSYDGREATLTDDGENIIPASKIDATKKKTRRPR